MEKFCNIYIANIMKYNLSRYYNDLNIAQYI